MEDYEHKGAKDDYWTPRCAAEDRFVITGDRGRKHDRTPLDLLLPFLGVNAAFLTGKLHSGRTQFEKMRAVIYLWPEIVNAALEAPAGTRFKIQIQGKGFALQEWLLTESQNTLMHDLFDDFEMPKGLFPNGEG